MVHTDSHDSGVQQQSGVNRRALTRVGRLKGESSSMDSISTEANTGRAAEAEIDDALPEMLRTDDAKHVLGDYELIQQIGRGGMGVVYEARQISLNKRVAVKILPLASVLQQRMVKRFHNEAWAAAQLEHPHIVPVYQVGCERGIHYYVMQYIEGSDLSHLLKDLKQIRRSAGMTNRGHDDPTPQHEAAEASKREGDEKSDDTRSYLSGAPSPPSHGSTQRGRRHDADTLVSGELKSVVSKFGSTAHPAYLKILLRVGIQAAEALDSAHQVGIVHRDIKPSNLMFDVKGNVWVTDFGLAQVQSNPGMTATGDIVGTLRYMSPEQALGKRVVVDHRSDIYSLGVTLYEMLTLHPAFGERSREAILRKIAFDDPVTPRKIDQQIPVELETIVMKAVSKNPNDRYQTAAELAEDLRRFRDDEPICGRRPTLRQRSVRWANRHRSAAAAAAGMSGITFISAIVIAIISWSYYHATAAMLETEQEQSAELSQMLRQSEGLRLAANAALQVPEDPGLAVALAIAGNERHPSKEANEAVLGALPYLHEQAMFAGHTAAVEQLATNADGTRAISAVSRVYADSASPKPARIWNLETGEPVGKLQDEKTITSAVFSPDRFRILTTASPTQSLARDDIDQSRLSNHVHMWDGLTQQKLLSFPDSFLFTAHEAAFDPAGRRIVLPSYGNRAVIYDCVAGHSLVTLEGHAARIVYAAFDPFGTRVVTASDDQTVRIWDAASGQVEHVIDYWRKRVRGELDCVVDKILFSPNGVELATHSSAFGIQLWDVATGQLGFDESWRAELIGYHPAGDRILTETTQRLEWRRTSTGERIPVVEKRSLFADATLSPDGSFVALYGQEGGISIFHTESGEREAVLRGHSGWVKSVIFTPNSRVVSGGNDKTVRLWNRQSEAERSQFATNHWSTSRPVIGWSPDGQHVAIASRPKRLSGRLDLTERRFELSLSGSVTASPYGAARYLNVTRDAILVRDTNTNDVVASRPISKDEVVRSVLSPTGKQVAIVNAAGRILLWEFESGTTMELEEKALGSGGIVFDREGAALAGIVTGAHVTVWDAQSGAVRGQLRNEPDVESLNFSPDGDRLVIAKDHSRALLFAIAAGSVLHEISDDEFRFNRAQFSYDGAHVITYRAQRGTGLSAWNAETGDKVSMLKGITGGVEIAVSPSRSEVVVCSDEAGTYLWQFVEDEKEQLSTTPAIDGQFFLDGEQLLVATASPPPMPWLRNTTASQSTKPSHFEYWRRDDLQTMITIPSPDGAIRGFTITAGDHVLGNVDQFGVAVHEVESTQLLAHFGGHASPIRYLGFTADGRSLVSASLDHNASIWDIDSAKRIHLLAQHEQPIAAADLAVRTNRLLTASQQGEAILWNTETGKALQSFTPFERAPTHVQLTAEANLGLLFARGGNPALYDLFDQRRLELFGGPYRAEWAELSPGGARLLVIPSASREADEADESTNGNGEATVEHSLVMLSLGEPQSKSVLPGAPVQTAHFHPSGENVLVVRATGELQTVDVQTGQVRRQYDEGGAGLFAAAYSPDGNFLTTVGQFEARVLDASTGRLLFRIDDFQVATHQRHTFQPIVPSGHWLIGRERDSRLKRWPLQPMEYANAIAPRPLSVSEQGEFAVNLLRAVE